MKLLLSILIHILFSSAVSAAELPNLVEQRDLNFKLKTDELFKGDVHYHVKLLPPRRLIEKYPDFYDLDSLTLLQEPGASILLSKAAFVVNKPVGFFDHEHMTNGAYLSHIMGQQRVQRQGNNVFKITVPGEDGFSYKLRTFYDSDDLSSLTNSKVIRAVATSKKLDVISLGASATVVREMTELPKFSPGGISVTNYISLKENKTLVITYTLTAIKKDQADEESLKQNLKREIAESKALIESFKPKK